MKQISISAVFLLSFFLHPSVEAAGQQSHSGKIGRSHPSSVHAHHRHRVREQTNGLQRKHLKVRPKEGCCVVGDSQTRVASFYSAREGKRTSSGDPYHQNSLTAATRAYPPGTRLQLENPDTGQSVIVLVNDKTAPQFSHRVDLPTGTARLLGISQKAGVLPVKVTILSLPRVSIDG